MTDRQLVLEKLYYDSFENILSDHPTPIELLTWAQKLVACSSDPIYTNLKMISYPGESGWDLKLEAHRPETDQEYADRQAKEKAREETYIRDMKDRVQRQKERGETLEREMYLKLHEKYGKVNEKV